MPRLALALAAACLAAAVPAAPANAAATPRAVADFNGDGYGDLAIGVPAEDLGRAPNAGAVVVLYGSAGGLRTSGSQVWSQDSTGVPGVAESSDDFGAALATGDFDGDGFSDLAVGAPGEDVDGELEAGAVNVLYGTAGGLRATGAQQWTESTSGVPGTVDDRQGMGTSLAVGDFDGDGRDDLAVGGPGVLTQGPRPDDPATGVPGLTGRVWTFRGTTAGLRPGPAFDDPRNDDFDYFGRRLAAGDFDGNGTDELVIAAYMARSGGPRWMAGALWVVRGVPGGGLSSTGWRIVDQATSGVPGVPEDGDQFGDGLATGDFDADGRDDLAVGAPGEQVGDGGDSGAVFVIPGTGSGLTGSGTTIWHKDTPGIPGTRTTGGSFGSALAAGDTNGDRRADLAVGIPAERVTSSGIDHGAVVVLFGSGSGITATRARMWHQNVTGVPGGAEPRDQFGWAVAFTDANGDRRHDLAVGVPSETLGSVPAAGAVNVLPGGSAGTGTAGALLLHQDVPGISSANERGDAFGLALAG